MCSEYKCLFFSKIKEKCYIPALAWKTETGLRYEIMGSQESFPINFILRRLIFDVPGLGDITEVEL